MGRIVRDAVVHEKTVQKVADNAILVAPYRKPRREGRSRNSKIIVSHWSDGVDPLIVAYVQQNEIHHSRIEVVSPGTIIIHNQEER